MSFEQAILRICACAWDCVQSKPKSNPNKLCRQEEDEECEEENGEERRQKKEEEEEEEDRDGLFYLYIFEKEGCVNYYFLKRIKNNN